MSVYVSNRFYRFSLSALISLGGIGLLSSGASLTAQSAHIPFLDPSSQFSSDQLSGKQGIPMEVLTDTQGVDFTPYIRQLTQTTAKAYLAATPIPAGNDKRTTILSFSVNREGKLTKLHLDQSSRDGALDRAAWQSVQKLDGFPLPAAFTGPDLSMRLRFETSGASR
jgi:TonB family protein